MTRGGVHLLVFSNHLPLFPFSVYEYEMHEMYFQHAPKCLLGKIIPSAHYSAKSIQEKPTLALHVMNTGNLEQDAVSKPFYLSVWSGTHNYLEDVSNEVVVIVF